MYGAPAAGERDGFEAGEGGTVSTADHPPDHIQEMLHDIKSRLWFSYREASLASGPLSCYHAG